MVVSSPPRPLSLLVQISTPGIVRKSAMSVTVVILESVSRIRNLPYPVLTFSGKLHCPVPAHPAKVNYTQRAASRIILSLPKPARTSRSAPGTRVPPAWPRTEAASKPETDLLHRPQGRTGTDMHVVLKSSATRSTRRLTDLARHCLQQDSLHGIALAATL